MLNFALLYISRGRFKHFQPISFEVSANHLQSLINRDLVHAALLSRHFSNFVSNMSMQPLFLLLNVNCVVVSDVQFSCLFLGESQGPRKRNGQNGEVAEPCQGTLGKELIAYYFT